MTFNWSTFATLGILAGTLHWLIARATVTRSFWGALWLPGWLDSLLRCAACSGFWIGIGLGCAGLRPLATSHTLLNVLVAGVAGMWLTPVTEGVLLWGLSATKMR
jgi:hypothetical protein